MSNKLTPGPYSEPGTYGTSRFEITAHGKRVAVFDRIEDARAYRALPDLLVSLESLVEYLSYSDDEGLIEHAPLMSAARAAIAKARGQA